MACEILQKFDKLATLPSVASALMRMAAEENVEVEEVSRLIETDPSTAARLLKVVNSAYSGLQGRVSSVNRAVVMLGVNGVRNVLLSMQVVDVFGREVMDRSSAIFEFWKHCLAVASASELVAENTGGVLPEDAFTAGLLHDIGKIALYSLAREDYLELIDEITKSGEDISEAERSRFGTSHVEAGRRLAEKWALPEAICRAISDHHLLPQVADFSDPVALTAAIVAAADDLVRRQRIGFSGTGESWEPVEEIMGLLGLDEANIEDILSHLVERISTRSSIINIEIEESDLYFESLRKANALLGDLNEELQQARSGLERSQKRLQAVTDLNASLGSSFTCEDALAGLAGAVYRDLLPAKVIAYWVDHSAGRVFGAVVNGASSTGSFSIEADKNASNDLTGIGADRDALVHVVQELAGQLDPAVGLSSLVAGRLQFAPITVGHSQRAGMLVECGARTPYTNDELRFFADAASLLLQRALLENKLRRESEKLKDSNRRSRGFYEQLLGSRKLAAIGRMAAGAAHEINNPLAIVSGRVQLLMKMEEDPSRQHHLEMIRSQCDRMSKIISDILTFGKPEAPAITSASLEEVVSGAVELVRDHAEERGTAINVDIPEGLPQIAADASKLEQALRNLLANAVDAVKEHGRIDITVELDEKGNFVSVSIADNGKGMDRETLEKIFEPFFTTKAGTGTGLGLAICHSIVASHGGLIKVRSTPGEGTVFAVSIPVWRA